MRPVFLFLLASLGFALAACGTTEDRTVVVQPAPGQTVVIPDHGDAHLVPRERS
jgi:hypothetical protein